VLTHHLYALFQAERSYQEQYMNNNNDDTEVATLASDCFWCSEAVFRRVKGVKSVLPGYSGGIVENPSYEEVCRGKTGHAESIQVEFDPKVTSFEKILDIFWHTHNPTTRNRQGNNVGTQYRSAIFFHNQTQKETAEKLKTELEKERFYTEPIVTEISPLRNFSVAEDYHKNYYEDHQGIPYCNIIISPKVKSLLRKYGNYVKEEYK
jgi:peptide-methionine (S)-S-oxide reductase